MRPMMALVRAEGGIPRTLADDLTIHARGVGHWSRLRNSANASHRYLHDAGSAIAPAKSVCFSTGANVRRIMRKHVWSELQITVQVALTARDLGAQANFGKVKHSGTLGMRMREVCPSLRRLACFPASVATKLRAISGKIVPKALYGAESTPVQHVAMRTLRNALKHCIGL
eukprot:10112393-Alexandrium_andersonii.AAC.1